MNKQQHIQKQDTSRAFAVYTTGFLLSIVLTLAAYWIVTRHVDSAHEMFSHAFVKYSIMSLAFVQLVVQLVFFLHIDKESKPRWNLMAFMYMAMVVLILIIGSMWIMDNLHYNMMSPQETEIYMYENEGF
ncbi:MAG: cytochrome o ubiquinol oxidase subunit IV [Candidatus Saccharimonadales bacterium]